MENFADNLEFEEMKRQCMLLKEKLDKEAIVNEKLIRSSMQDKVSYIVRRKRIVMLIAIVGLFYCTYIFSILGFSMFLRIFTCIFLLVAVGYNYYSSKGMDSQRVVSGNLLEVSEALVRMNLLGIRWFYFAIPTVLFWLGWFIYECFQTEGGSYMAYGGIGGFIVGAIIGLRLYFSMRRKSKEVISQIEELENYKNG
ncbi:hypothetical protein [uncultured Bacteroides sp.]|uniref:hypothetical protein n=1 Tax=uncultured Bacteroides sp. TaxID=162156 RepID=UPI0026388341|nr:hypothetical protein [uncultured Bacteroides sp.]